MTPGALSRHLFAHYENSRVDHLTPRSCIHAELMPVLDGLVQASAGVLSMTEAGRSAEGRPIMLLSFGRGEKRVLLWSQMHGDEPTATLALADMLTYLVHHGARERWVRELLHDVTVFIVPMLNPDGAERVQRRTASGIDMNRDARALVTPEGALLRSLQRRLKPRFGFNLHDQELSSVGQTTNVSAIALLAPALDARRSMPMSRLRAVRVAALIARSLGQFADGHLSRYRDDFEPRAFGDSMQAWGTSTVLIESGHWPGDRTKTFIRKLNVVALLTALRSIGDGSYQDVDLDHYGDLPENGKQMYDIVIRDATLRHPGGERFRADIGLLIENAHNRHAARPVVTIKDLGDLSTFGALETIDGRRRAVPASSVTIDRVVPLHRLMDELELYYPA